MGARIDTFPKGSRLLRAGEAVEEVGLVLAGSALIVQEDIWGNRNLLSKTGPGQTFAEVFACAPGAVLNVSVEAESTVTVMFLHIRRVLSMCPSACSHHSRIIRNLLGELAEKNLRLNEKLTHMGQRTTRAKLMSYFSAEAQRRGGYEFDIPFSRQQLADYLGVERSGLSLELGKMRDEGLLDFHKSHFSSQNAGVGQPSSFYAIRSPPSSVSASADTPGRMLGFYRRRAQLRTCRD